jgi:hypothetical protein
MLVAGAPAGDERAAEMRALGAVGAVAKPRPGLAIWPENWPAVRVMVSMATQWRRAGMAGIEVGLDYAALPVVCAALSVPLDEDLLSRMRVMEAAALSALAERRG